LAPADIPAPSDERRVLVDSQRRVTISYFYASAPSRSVPSPRRAFRHCLNSSRDAFFPLAASS